MNITMLLEMAAEGMGDRVAVGSSSGGRTYAELLERSRQVGEIVRRGGVERVGMVATNSADLPTLLYASAVAGVPFAPLNYRLADDRLQAVCKRIAPALVLAEPDAAGRISGIEGITVVSSSKLDERGAEAPQANKAQVDPEQVAVWLFTSGTTGEPKAALLRHRHLVSYVLSTVDYMAAGEAEATLVSVPPYHVAAIAAILSNTYAGRRIVYLPRFDPDEWVKTAESEGITHAMVVPTMLGRILEAIEHSGHRLRALRHLSYGGGRMPLAVVERAMNLLPEVGFVNAYGLTETSSTVAVLGPEDHRLAFASDDPELRARLGSVGRPLPTLELEIRGPQGMPLPAGETGEIYVRGDQIAGEYEGRRALSDDGWFATRDGGRVDNAGFLFIDGRLDDVIVRGGENLSPGEIEDVLLAHPSVAEAVVVGLPDDEWGELPAAAVVLGPGSGVSEGDLKDWVRDRLRSSQA
ncbi:MAG: class I adenylate-forming enzyme family protein, partial [Acidimicrobiales bacterium]